MEPYQALANNFNQKYKSVYDEFVSEMMPIIAAAVGIPIEHLRYGFIVNEGTRLQRLHAQLGPCADLYTEVI